LRNLRSRQSRWLNQLRGTNAIIAAGFGRYGFMAEAGRIARDLNEAAGHFVLNQMPELYAGLSRTPFGFPVQYVGANVPQA